MQLSSVGLVFMMNNAKLEASTTNIHADLIRRCRIKDPSAQFELYEIYNKAMFNTALRITGTEMDAEDVLQEAFVSAFQHLESYKGEATFGAWLKQIVVNEAISLIQKNKREVMVARESGREEAYDRAADDADPPYSVKSIKNAVAQLPTGFRTVLSLYLFEGYDHQEISKILNISESTSKTQYKRAKNKLKLLLKKK